ncbi:MAG: GNAT family N-acetyltransferase [Haloferacaceae archaeon]|jgi:ribosomal protein S18 acetylase RimI-like enzyme
MDVRDATAEDVDAIRTVARESLAASYGHTLPEGVIDESVERWYDAEGLAEEVDRDDAVLLVAVEDGQVVGFAQSYVVSQREVVGDVDWVHVLPKRRGEGIGTELLQAVEAALRDRDVDRVEAKVLETNDEGVAFYEDHGFDPSGERTVEIGDARFVERLFSKPFDDEAGSVVLEARRGPDDRRLYVDYDARERASLGPFYVAYADRDREERYGWFCSNCGGFEAAMDSMGRVECANCGNRRKPSRWDAAYL